MPYKKRSYRKNSFKRSFKKRSYRRTKRVHRRRRTSRRKRRMKGGRWSTRKTAGVGVAAVGETGLLGMSHLMTKKKTLWIWLN